MLACVFEVPGACVRDGPRAQTALDDGGVVANHRAHVFTCASSSILDVFDMIDSFEPLIDKSDEPKDWLVGQGAISLIFHFQFSLALDLQCRLLRSAPQLK